MTGPTTGEHNLDRIDHAWIKLTHVRHLLEIDGAWRLERQPLQSHLLIFVAGGQGHLSVNGAGHTLASEEAYLVHPGQDVEGDMYPFENKGVYMFTFEMGYTDSAAKRGQLDPPVCVFPLSGSVPVATNAAISLCQSICAHWFATDKLQRLRSQSLIHELLYSLLREQAPPVQESSLAAMMSKAKAYIEQHYREQVSFEKLATDAGISSRHFRRLFIAMYGKRPVDYLTELRMNHAKKRM
ncbi:MAG: AraC family transcriptional regulator, partial [Paenibacillus sp.]|nr:AraC family transcriptional regulator [Paenibacillus sp.]